MLLVKYSDNYADEFDVEGFQLFTPEGWERFKETVETSDEVSFPHEWYFGTNEYINFESFEDYLSKLTITSITMEQTSLLMSLFGDRVSICGYGLFPDLEP